MIFSTSEVARSTGTEVSPLDLRERYAAYRKTQAAALVRMLAQDAIRPLYRKAREAVGPGDSEDPLSLLVSYCEQILPLPPFDVWRRDLAQNPDAHLRDLDGSAAAPTVSAPSTVEVREVSYQGRRWRANLRSFRDQGVWRGFIAFDSEHGSGVYRTTEIFCESELTRLRERFISFSSATLEAFLRSSLP